MEVRFQNENAVFEAVRDMIFDVLRRDEALTNIPEMALSPDESPRPIFTNRVAIVNPALNRPGSEETIPKSESVNIPQKENRPDLSQAIAGQPAETKPAYSPQNPIIVPVRGGEARPVFRETYMPAPLPKPVVQAEQTRLAPKAENPSEHQQTQDTAAEEAAPPALSEKNIRPEIHILGVVFQTYILIEYGDQLLLIDQHAAHERLLFDQMMKAYDQHKASQTLLVPQAVQLTPREQETLHENQEALEASGFEISSFGDRAVQVRAVPLILGQPQAKSFLLEALDQLETMRGLTTLEKRRTAILQMACKRAVKGGERLPMVEIEDLVRRATESSITPTCPHGRPLVVAITHQELDKRFKRIQ
jgi:DNA mismatch repair protein MutL